MKRLVMAVVAVAVAGLVGGCASPGGMTYVGPVSYYHAKHADKAMMMRSAAVSPSIPVEKKESVFKAVRMGSGPNEIAAGVGVDVFALTSGDYTGGEVFMQFLSSLCDAAIYAGAGYGAKQALTGGSDSSTKSVTTYTIVNNGNGNNNNVNGGAGAQGNNSSSSSGVTGDGSETANQ